MKIIRKAATGKLPGTLTYVLSDATRDRYGDIIEPNGWQLDHFRANPIALFSHQGSFPIGNWDNVRVENGKLIADYLPADPGTSERVDEVNSLIRQNVLKATSVGFNPMESAPIDPEKPYAGTRFTKQELLETSIVSVPANPATLQIARCLNISDDTMSLVFGAHALARRRDMSPGASADHQSPRTRATPMDIQTPVSRQIEDRQSMLNAARDALADLARDPNHDAAEANLLNDEIEEHENRLVDLKRTERSLAFRTTGETLQQPQVPNPAVHRRPLGLVTPEVKPIDLQYRAIGLMIRANVLRRSIDDVLHEYFPDDEPTAIVTRAAVTGATTAQTGWAADLVAQAQGAFVDTLQPNSVFIPLAASGGASLTFGPGAGVIRIPSRSPTPSIGGSFVAEAAAIPVRRMGTTSIILSPHKVAGLAVYSKEIAQYSNPDIDQLVRTGMDDDSKINVDGVLLDAGAASTVRPAGLINGVTAIPASTAHGYAAILADIQALTAPFYAANAGRRLVLIMSPVQGQQLLFAPGPAGVPFGWTQQFTSRFQVIESTNVAAGTVYMVDAIDFVSASGAPQFDVSEETTLHMEDTTPLNIGTPGSPAVVAAPVQSMFQTAQIAVRMIANVTWAMRRAGMVQYMTGVNWGP